MGGPSGNGNSGRERGAQRNRNQNVDRKNPGGYNFGGEGENAGGRQADIQFVAANPKPKSVEQPKVKSQMSNTDVKSKAIVADKTAPTTVEVEQDEIALKNKKKGRKATVLTSVTGVQGYPTLSKKTLLGG